MNAVRYALTLLLGLLLLSCGDRREAACADPVAIGFRTAEAQLSAQLRANPVPGAYPRTVKDNRLYVTTLNDWTEGFFPGCLWYVYEYTGGEEWKQAAIRWTEALEPLKKLTHHHALGFLMYCSFGNAYRLTGDARYKAILVESARSLCTRFNERTGCIESWNYRRSWNGRDEWFYPVIIDNLMNLELLYFATRVTGDSLYARVATTHALTTARHHFRPDYSSYHVVDYDERTGRVLHRGTCQGYADNSTWARGQAWAIYGYTMAYRETGIPQFLSVAVRAADFWLNHPRLPADGIPYWDFNAGQEGYAPDWNYAPQRFPVIPRDASAAAIAASAFLELSGYVEDGRRYRSAANHILRSLTSPAYLASPGTNGHFLLKHCVGSVPHGTEVDVPLVYADYYFLEALLRYRKAGEK